MREKIDFDEKQLRAIETRGDLIVSASAGSGKTTVMIERILRLIEGGADLKRMLIVTFTRAAAADMRAKLSKALRSEAENEFCARALGDLPAAQISTLHSFCGNIARTYFYAIGVDPSFTLLDENDGAVLSRCMDELCEEISESGSRLYEILMSSRKDKRFRKAVLALYNTAIGMPRPREWLLHCLDCYDDDTEAKKIIADDFARERAKLAELARDCLIRTLQAGFDRNVAALESVIDALSRNDRTLFLPSPNSSVPPDMSDLNEEYKQLRSAADKLLGKEEESKDLCPSALAKPYAEEWRDAALDLMERYEAAKKKNSRADYNDLEHYAYEILLSPIGEKIRADFDYIFVDEYQDINPLQDAIISLVRSEGNLFLVGDLKQSIYAFRGCDPSIFAEKYESFRRGGKSTVELNKNFRTLPEAVDGINRVFDGCMRADFGGVDYKKEARLSGTRTGKGGFAYVNVTTGEEEKRRAESDVYHIRDHAVEPDLTAAESESEYVVSQILQLLTYRDEDGMAVNPEDIAVLSRSVGLLACLIRDKLSEAGIPVFLKEEKKADRRREIAPLIAMLRLIDNAADDIVLTSVLLSYIGGFKSDDLAEAAESKREDEPFFLAARRYEKFRAFFEKADRYTVLAQSVSAGELLSEIVRECDVFVKVRKLYGEDGERVLSDFLASASSAGALPEFLEKTDESGLSAASAPQGCVKIMTVHMSKGLEFEHVFYVGAGHRFNMRDFYAPYFIDRDFGAAFKYPDSAARKFRSTVLTEAVKTVKLHRALEEEMRIAYVAMTRARKTLTVVGCNIPTDPIKQKISRPIRACDFFTAVQPKKVDLSETVAADEMPKSVPVFAGADEEAAAKIKERMNYVYPFKSAAAKTTVSERIAQIEDDGYYYGETSEIARTENGGERAEAAAKRGTAVHLFLQHYDFDADFPARAAAFAARYPEEAVLIDAEKLRVCVGLVAEKTAGYKLYREKEFIADEGGTLLQGVIDLLAVKDGEAIVIDYKTGANPENPRYAAQLSLYANAVEKLLGLKVSACYICAVDCLRLIRIERRRTGI